MKRLSFSIFLGLATLLAGCTTMNTKNSRPPVKLGVEVLFEKRLDLIRGKHVGLITNPTGLDSKLDSIIEKFRALGAEPNPTTPEEMDAYVARQLKTAMQLAKKAGIEPQ